jgi:hypothetical protein
MPDERDIDRVAKDLHPDDLDDADEWDESGIETRQIPALSELDPEQIVALYHALEGGIWTISGGEAWRDGDTWMACATIRPSAGDNGVDFVIACHDPIQAAAFQWCQDPHAREAIYIRLHEEIEQLNRDHPGLLKLPLHHEDDLWPEE